MRHIHSIILFCLLFCTALPGLSQVKFTASVSPEKIGTKDYATLRYTVVGSFEIEHLYPPDFKHVELISGPNSEISGVKINGKESRSISFVFVIRPLKPGKIILPPARARISGRDHESNAVTLEVLNAATAAPKPVPGSVPDSEDDEILRPGDDVDEKIRNNMVLRLETDKKEVYIGEPVLASFKLYSRLKSNSRLTENPSFNGFSVVDLQLPDVSESETGNLNGRDFNVYTIRKVLLYPLQSGTFTIEKLQMENNVQFIQPGSVADPYDLFSFFDPGYGRMISEQVLLETQPVDIVVKPLPELHRPKDFSGAVGNFNVTASLARSEFKANEEGRLIVEISGKGNLQLVNAPAMRWPGSVEAFDPKVDDTINTAAYPVVGMKSFEYVFSVSRPGSYVIPAVSFSYFDPEKEKYQTAESQPLFFTVTPAVVATVNANTALESSTASKRPSLAWLLIPASCIAIVLLFVVFRKLRNEYLLRKKLNGHEAVQIPAVKPAPEFPLTLSSKICDEGNSGEFYPVLNRELKGWLISKFCLQASEVSMERLRECMDENNVPNSLVLEALALLREIEWQLYVPVDGTGKMQEHYARARMLVKEMQS